MASGPFLLVQLADIGDLVLTTPALAALRAAQPQAQLDLLASRHALPILPPDLVDRRIPFDKGAHSASRALFSAGNLRRLLALRHGNYAAVVFFHHFTLRAGTLKFRLIARAAGAARIIGLQNGQAGFLSDSIPDAGFGDRHEAQYWLDLVSLLGAENHPRPAAVHREHFAALPAAPAQSSQPRPPTVVIHAGSGGYSPARRWAPARFAAVAQQLKAQHAAQIILVGTAADDSAQVARQIDFAALDLTGKTSLPQLADVIARADLFIGADSGVMHIAAASGTPVLSLFGPSNSRAWQPWLPAERRAVLNSGVACSPCSYIGGGIGAREGCAARTCMKLLHPQPVLAAAQRLLAGQPPKSPAPAQQPAAPRPFARINIAGIPVDAITYEQWMRQIGEWVRHSDQPQHVCTVNPEFIIIARQDPIFRSILNRAALCVPDGIGLLWASRQLGSPLPERVTGSDGVPLIARRAAAAGWSIFFLGAAEGIAKKAAAILQQQHPQLKVAGTYSGSPAEAEEDHIIAQIQASSADILFVAYGAPQQDKWIARNLPRLPVKMAMGVGGSLDFIAGSVPRAPLWMRRRGLEWLYRLLRQPWRLRRMLRLPRFVTAVLRQRTQTHPADSSALRYD